MIFNGQVLYHRKKLLDTLLRDILHLIKVFNEFPELYGKESSSVFRTH